MFKETKKLDKASVEQELKAATEKMELIKKAEMEERAKQDAIARKKHKDETKYKNECLQFKINQSASKRYEAYLQFVNTYAYETQKTGIDNVRKMFRVTKICAFLDTLDEQPQFEVKYTE
jgi:hypothetical protein